MQQAESAVVATLAVVVHPQGDRVLLGRKKRGFGFGKFTGFGGKLEPGESPIEAMQREFAEESFFALPQEAFEEIGLIEFLFPHHPGWGFHCHIFRLNSLSETPQPSDELDPQWFALDNLPWQQMWADNAHWLRLAAQGEHFAAVFEYGHDDEHLQSYHVRWLPGGGHD